MTIIMSPPSANNEDLLAIIYSSNLSMCLAQKRKISSALIMIKPESASLAYGASFEFYVDCVVLPSEFRASLLARSSPHAFIQVTKDTEIRCLLDIKRQICETYIKRIEANRENNSLTPSSDVADYESDTRSKISSFIHAYKKDIVITVLRVGRASLAVTGPKFSLRPEARGILRKAPGGRWV